jgi:hypothetical protein
MLSNTISKLRPDTSDGLIVRFEAGFQENISLVVENDGTKCCYCKAEAAACGKCWRGWENRAIDELILRGTITPDMNS